MKVDVTTSTIRRFSNDHDLILFVFLRFVFLEEISLAGIPIKLCSIARASCVIPQFNMCKIIDITSEDKKSMIALIFEKNAIFLGYLF